MRSRGDFFSAFPESGAGYKRSPANHASNSASIIIRGKRDKIAKRRESQRKLILITNRYFSGGSLEIVVLESVDCPFEACRARRFSTEEVRDCFWPPHIFWQSACRDNLSNRFETIWWRLIERPHASCRPSRSQRPRKNTSKAAGRLSRNGAHVDFRISSALCVGTARGGTIQPFPFRCCCKPYPCCPSVGRFGCDHIEEADTPPATVPTVKGSVSLRELE